MAGRAAARGLLAVLASLGAGVGRTASAQPPPLRFDRLSVEEGLSGSVVQAIARDAVGFLWAGTQYGLDRYDGVRVVTFGNGSGGTLPSLAVRAVAVDRGVPGGLWVGTSGGLARYDPYAERLSAYRGASGGPDPLIAPVGALLSDRGGVWVGTVGSGLVRLDQVHGRVEVFRYRNGSPHGVDSVRALLAPAATPGVLWVGTAAGLVRFDTQRRAFEDVGLPDRRPVTALAEADGAIWCATADSVLHRVDPATARAVRSVRLGADVSALSASAAHGGLVWVGTRGGGLLALRSGTGAIVPANDDEALGRAHVVSLAEDSTGLLWVGTTNALLRADVRGPRFTPIGPDIGPDVGSGPAEANGLSAPAVFALYEAPSEPGVVWVGTVGGGVNRLDRRTGDVRRYFTVPGDPLGTVFSIHEDRGGNLWLGSERATLHLFDRRTGGTRPYPMGPPRRNPVYQIYEAPSRPGVLWAATATAGLFEFDASRRVVRRRFSTASRGPARLGSDLVWAVLEAPDEPGVLWVATEGAGLYRLDVQAGAAEPVRGRSGCRIGDRLLSLAAGPGSTLWIGTLGEGLLRYDRRTGACRRYTPEDGLPSRDVAAVYIDAQRRVWMSTRTGGVALFNPASGVFTRFSVADGLQGNVFYFLARHQTAGGELLFGGPNGFNLFNPDSVRVEPAPPRVVLTRVLVDERPYALARAGQGLRPLVLSYDQHDLSFEFAALDLRDPPNNRYRVRLDGADAGWRSLGNRAEARYPYLPPGRYTFRVDGTNGDGYWSGAGAALPIVIRPPFWRTWYFWSLLGSTVVGLIVAGYQYRIRQLHRVERTRRRIADHLHDGIGSAISSVALRLDLAGGSAGLSEADRAHLAELSRDAREVVDGLRDAVWFVDGGHDDLPALVARMEQFAGRMLRGRPYAFVRPEELPPAPLGMEERRDLYLFFKEALHNAVRHGAGRIEIGVAYEGGRLAVLVADEGPGFDPNRPPDGRGLKSMRARAEALGGELLIESAPGAGTAVRLLVAIK